METKSKDMRLKMDNWVSLLKKKLMRAQRAQDEAERLLEQKSNELYRDWETHILS